MLGLALRAKRHADKGDSRPAGAAPVRPRCLDSLLSDAERPVPGTHIVSPRYGYLHHGIYIGQDRVVHYPGLVRGVLGGPIEEASLAEFAKGRRVWTCWTDRAGFDRQEVMRRARSRLGENRYRLLHNNCEHFCEWCVHGEPRSYQVERLLFSWSALMRTLAVMAACGRRAVQIRRPAFGRPGEAQQHASQ